MNKLFALLLFCFLGLVLIFSPSFIHASGFTTAYLRLVSSANSALSGTVCAQPSSSGAGTENKVIVVFPDDFNISSSLANWQVNTSNLPEGGASWPGISSATAVSGQTVTFPSSDLTSNVLYCFNFSSSLSSTGSSGNDKNGTISTKNSSNVLIDTATYAVSVLSNNQVTVTASVDPKISDLPIEIESTTQGADFPQNTTISYKITYGSNAGGSIPLTIQAQWSEGTIQGSTAPSFEVLSYVIGSAGNAYGSTPAVIDTVNKTITWNISSFPGGTTGKTVVFSLKTNDAYTGDSRVDFNVSARAISGQTVTPDDNVSQTYLYDSSLNPPTPTPTPGSSQTSSTSIPTPVSPQNLTFSDVSINSISQSDAQILVTTTKNSSVKILYGTSIASLDKSLVSSLPFSQVLLTLPDLEPNTTYYFKIIATDENGNSVTSDIFSFQTAEVSEAPTINLDTLLVTSSDNVLFSPALISPDDKNALKKNVLVVPTNSIFTIQFALDKRISVKKIQAIIRNSKVLGANTTQPVQASTDYVDLVEVQPGVYNGRLATPEPGSYEIYVRVIDYSGNIVEKKIADLKVTRRLSVFKRGTKEEPVENARLVLYLYNRNLKTYQVISSQILSIKNPSYSLADGTYDLVLPFGQYKAEFEAIGYESQTVIFKIGAFEKGYPTVYLKQQPFNILNSIRYYLNTLSDFIISSQDYIRSNAYSNRLFDLSSFGAVFVFVLAATFSISARTHINILYLPYFLIFKLKILLKGHKSNIFFGKVLDEDSDVPISRTDVNIISKATGTVLARLKTNKLGEFYFQDEKNEDLEIRIVKEGFKQSSNNTYVRGKSKDFPFVLKVKKLGERHLSILRIIFIYFEDFVGICAESLLLLGIVVQIYFLFTFGFLRVAPFLALTVVNLILIFTYLYKPKALA